MLIPLLQAIAPAAEEIAHKADSAKVSFEQFAENLVKDPGSTLQDLGQAVIMFGLKLLAAILIYIVGAWLIRSIKKRLTRILAKRATDKALATFIQSFTSISLTIILVLVTVGTLGVNTTSIAALLAAGGVAIGMALSGTVQNFAGGIMILAFKPFKAGDFIEAQGYSGTISAVTIVSTVLTTVDNKTVIIPNGALFNGNINNYSRNPLRRVSWDISVEYGTDSKECAKRLMEMIKADKRVLDSGTEGAADPFVALSSLGDSAVIFTVRAWVTKEDFWDVFYDFNSAVYEKLPEYGIRFPFQQMDVHIHQDSSDTAPATIRKA